MAQTVSDASCLLRRTGSFRLWGSASSLRICVWESDAAPGPPGPGSMYIRIVHEGRTRSPSLGYGRTGPAAHIGGVERLRREATRFESGEEVSWVVTCTRGDKLRLEIESNFVIFVRRPTVHSLSAGLSCPSRWIPRDSTLRPVTCAVEASEINQSTPRVFKLRLVARLLLLAKCVSHAPPPVLDTDFLWLSIWLFNNAVSTTQRSVNPNTSWVNGKFRVNCDEKRQISEMYVRLHWAMNRAVTSGRHVFVLWEGPVQQTGSASDVARLYLVSVCLSTAPASCSPIRACSSPLSSSRSASVVFPRGWVVLPGGWYLIIVQETRSISTL